jgi:tripartite-type tricarboxylate transporter receptor subunit TctC
MLRIITAAVVATCCGLQQPAAGQDVYPSRPIRLIVPYSAGGASDVMARYFGEKLGAILKQPVIIENQATAAGTVAYVNVARAQPDGYTLSYGTSSLAVNAALRRNPPYDPIRDFAPVSPLLVVQNVLIVPASLPVNSLAELVALAKQKPGALNYVSLGRGSTPHLAMELFRSAAGIVIEQVPYKLTPQAYTDLIEGRVQLWLASMPSALPFIRSGKLRALAVAGSKRSPALPDVPTLAEAGIAAETSFWQGLFAPAGTPPAIVARLNQAVAEITAQETARDWYLNLGAELGGGTPEQLAAEVLRDNQKWSKIAKEIGIEIED